MRGERELERGRGKQSERLKIKMFLLPLETLLPMLILAC